MDVVPPENRPGEWLGTVGQQGNRPVEFSDGSRVLTEVRRGRPPVRILDRVEHLPEPTGIDPVTIQDRAPRLPEPVPQHLRLAVRERTPEPVADAIEHRVDVVPVDVDERAVEIDHPEVVLFGEGALPAESRGAPDGSHGSE